MAGSNWKKVNPGLPLEPVDAGAGGGIKPARVFRTKANVESFLQQNRDFEKILKEFSMRLTADGQLVQSEDGVFLDDCPNVVEFAKKT